MIPRLVCINDDEFNRLKNLGMNQKQIAKVLGISESTVSIYVKEKKKKKV